ncbi:MAG: Long-chain-fatty-acid--CoA ligase [Syntrophorhabdus sp. PtaU1.Bin058]|nr:MAG: Long-chain-fatty-acid--CoA ligase [Syntrophorhabdus sp. PtaU1.Bin058]
MTIPDYLEKNARHYPTKTAIIVPGDRSCTFIELKERSYRLANGLMAAGLKKGDRVAILAENCFEYPEMYFGIGKAGGVATPLSFRFAPPEVVHLINESGARILIVQDKYVDLIQSVRPELKSVEQYICVGNTADGMRGYEDLLASAPATDPGVEIAMEDIFCLMHTGGTTGVPKLTVLTHRNLLSCAVVWIVECGFTYGDVFMVISPLFHTGGAWPLFFSFILGNTFVVQKKYNVDEMLKTIEQEKVTASMWMSQLIPGIITHPDVEAKKYDLSSLRIILAGAAVLPEPHLRRLLELFPGIRVCNAGGQTECGIFTGMHLDECIDNFPEKLASAGRASIHMRIKIVDEQDNELPADEAGELCVRGEGVMKGYWNKPEESAWSLRGGWQHTGDICKTDKDGYLYYVDRKKDMIKTGGENVYSKEVEDVLYLHPAVAGAAVIGVPDEKWGEAVAALIIAKEGKEITQEELVAHCRKHIAGYKCPKLIEFRREFPQTSLGKIDKKALREPYWKELKRAL